LPPLSIPVAGLDAASHDQLASPLPGSVAAAKTQALDVADTSSFISEDDLPEWIRQLAAADEAKKAEELRRIADAAAADSQAGVNGDPRQRRPLPGETAAAGPATSPWLTRRERTDGAETVAAASWGAIAAQAPANDGVSNESDIVQAQAAISTTPPEPAIAPSDQAAPMPATPNANLLRLVLAAAVVLAVVALIAFMAVS
jgi:hypothetical protein